MTLIGDTLSIDLKSGQKIFPRGAWRNANPSFQARTIRGWMSDFGTRTGRRPISKYLGPRLWEDGIDLVPIDIFGSFAEDERI